ncbi:hypothetical protein FDB52_05785 [Clostridium botulinum]|nr:hypothetical protein [Clostridium botulinum]NFN48066.1 hypothetical protein [Clostridium botulinum]
MKDAAEILKILTKDELVEYVVNNYLVLQSLRYANSSTEKEAADIAIKQLRNRQIKRNNESIERIKNSPKTNLEFLKMIEQDEKDRKEYDRIEKQIQKLEQIR